MINNRYLVFKQDDGFLLTTHDNALDLSSKKLLNWGTFQYDLYAVTWEEASAIYHLRQGWEPYDPGLKSTCSHCNAVYYPDGSGQCWRCEFGHED